MSAQSNHSALTPAKILIKTVVKGYFGHFSTFRVMMQPPQKIPMGTVMKLMPSPLWQAHLKNAPKQMVLVLKMANI
jgi:hypothetical protein